MADVSVVLSMSARHPAGAALEPGAAPAVMPPSRPLAKLTGLLPALESLHAAAAQKAHAEQLLTCRNVRAVTVQSAQPAAPEAKQVSACAGCQHAWPRRSLHCHPCGVERHGCSWQTP